MRRFRRGIRNRKGKVDKKQVKQLKFNLLKEEEQTWENALDAASRWEAANDIGSSDSESDSSSSSSEELETVEDRKKKSSKKRKGKKVAASVAFGSASSIATLTDKVETNARDIKGVKSENERLSANVKAWKDETTSTLNEILQTVKSNQQTNHSSHQQQGYQPSYQQYRNPNRPNSYVWKGRFGQNQQTGFRFNRSSPATFPKAPLSAAAPAPTAAAAAPATIANVEQVDPAAQLLGAEGGDRVVMSMEQFWDLTSRAGQEVEESDLMAALSELNFG